MTEWWEQDADCKGGQIRGHGRRRDFSGTRTIGYTDVLLNCSAETYVMVLTIITSNSHLY